MNQCEECKKPVNVKCCHNCKKNANKCKVYHACGKDCPEWIEGVKTNADRIRAMSDDELAAVIMCPKDISANVDECIRSSCLECCKEWLQQPAEEVPDNA